MSPYDLAQNLYLTARFLTKVLFVATWIQTPKALLTSWSPLWGGRRQEETLREDRL